MGKIKIIGQNRKARYNYSIHEQFEAGIQLQGTEIKSLRSNKVSISESHVSIDSKNEAWIHNIKIPQYDFGNRFNHEEARKRKLLLHKAEIEELSHRAQSERLTIIPLKIYFKNSKVKLEIALAKGKKLYDKRQDEAKKDIKKRIKKGEY